MDARLHNFGDTATHVAQAPLLPRCKAEIDLCVLSHNALVKRIAGQVFSRMSRAIEFEDLLQIGRLALVEAAQTYVDHGEAAFASYATLRIRGAMIDALRHAATVTRRAIRQNRQFRDTRKLLAGRLGRDPRETEMAAQLGMTATDYQAIEATLHSAKFVSIDDSYSDHSEWFADHTTPDAYAVVEADMAQAAVAAAVAKLPEREQIVLQLFFVEEMTLGEIGRVLDVSDVRVCQIKRAALALLRRQLRGWSVH
jgi:RNA polymerase sigma factor for flagellar operon FliA